MGEITRSGDVVESGEPYAYQAMAVGYYGATEPIYRLRSKPKKKIIGPKAKAYVYKKPKIYVRPSEHAKKQPKSMHLPKPGEGVGTG